MPEHRKYETPLLQKIGIKEGMATLLIDADQSIPPMFKTEGYEFETEPKSNEYDIIWFFTNDSMKLELGLKTLKKKIKPNGMIWVSWYKKASKMPTLLTEDIIRDTALALDLVDVKVASVNDKWSALKLVIPLKKR